MKNEEIISMLRWLNDRWIKVPQKLHVMGKDITGTPKFISLTYKESDITSVRIINGEAVKSSALSYATGYSVSSLVGDEKQGYGGSRLARGGVPRKLNVIRGLMDETMDEALKIALATYLTFLQTSICISKENGFLRYSSDPVVNYVEDRPNVGIISKELVAKLGEWSKKMSLLPHIGYADAYVTSDQGRRCFVDSEGRIILDHSFLGSIGVQMQIDHDHKYKIPFSDNIPVTSSWDKPIPKLEAMLEKMKDYSYRLKSSAIPLSNQYPVILSGQGVGVLAHEALGAHLLSGRYISEGISTTFKGQLGKRILPEFLTIIDDPQMKGATGHYKYDEEGIEGKRIILVQDGILRNYLLDRDSAYSLKRLSNGHSRMGWVVCHNEEGEIESVMPEPRVGNIEVISRKCVPDDELVEIMKKHCRDNRIEYGLYVESGAGDVSIETGEFRLYPGTSWKIFPSGKKQFISNFLMIGNPYELLKQIKVTGTARQVSHGICGSSSGGVPTQEIAPAAFIPRMTVQACDPIKYTKRLLEKITDEPMII